MLIILLTQFMIALEPAVMGFLQFALNILVSPFFAVFMYRLFMLSMPNPLEAQPLANTEVSGSENESIDTGEDRLADEEKEKGRAEEIEKNTISDSDSSAEQATSQSPSEGVDADELKSDAESDDRLDDRLKGDGRG